MSCSAHWGRLLAQRSLARPTLRPLCATRVATLARVDTLAVGRVAGHVPRAGRAFVPKWPMAETAPLPGKGCHAATGPRIVPWRQPGDWLLIFRSPPPRFSAPSPTYQPAAPGLMTSGYQGIWGLCHRLPSITDLSHSRVRAWSTFLHLTDESARTDPDPGLRLSHRGFEHWPTTRPRMLACATEVAVAPCGTCRNMHLSSPSLPCLRSSRCPRDLSATLRSRLRSKML
jgi:hypothetical protein